MDKIKFIQVGLALTVISLLGGALYFGVFSSHPLTVVRLSNILFFEFLVFFSVGNLLYFKNKFWNQHPWKRNEEEDEELEDLEPGKKGRNLMLISLPLGIISILITLV